MSMHLRDVDMRTIRTAKSKTHAHQKEGDDNSATSSGAITVKQRNTKQGLQPDHYGFAFEKDLLASAVYRRPLFNESGKV